MDDFLVIGGGIAGLAAGAELAALGRVRVLEGERGLGAHTSGRSAAMFIPPYGTTVQRALNEASGDALRAADVLSPRGVLLVAAPGDTAALADKAAAFGAERIGPEAARAALPILRTSAIGGAARYDGASDIDTDRLMQHCAARIRAAGGTVETAQPVTAITRAGDGWKVTADAPHEARHIVNAAGAWADGIARLAGVAPVGLTPMRRSLARLPAPSGHDTRDWPFTLEVHDRWYARPDAGAWLVSPCEEDATDPHDAWADDMVVAEGLDRYSRFVTEEVTRVQTTWAGLRTFAPDRAPVVGPDPGAPSFLWFAGQGGSGFQSARATAALLADLVAGRAPRLGADMAAALSPGRFA